MADRDRMDEERSSRGQYRERLPDLARHFLFRNVRKNRRFVINHLIIGTIVLILMLPKMGADFNFLDNLGILGAVSIAVDFSFEKYCETRLMCKIDEKGLEGSSASFYEDYLNFALSGFIVLLPTMIYLTVRQRDFWLLLATIFVMGSIEKKLNQKAIIKQLKDTREIPVR